MWPHLKGQSLQPTRSYKTSGFTLVELMIVIMITGILGVISVPSFVKYRHKAKIVESYITLDALTKGQKTFFIENNEFRRLFGAPMRPYYENAQTSYITVEDTLDLKELGYPVKPGTTPYFRTLCSAGKTDETGTDVTTAPGDYDEGQYGRVLVGRSGAPIMSLNDSGPQACDPIINTRFFNGLDPGDTPPNYNWVVMISYANFNNQNCSTVRCDSCYANVKSIINEGDGFSETSILEFKEDFLE